MDQQPHARRIVPLAGMVVVLLLALGLDRVLLLLREENARTFTLGYALLWTYVLASLLMAVCLLMLFWIVVVKGDSRKLVAAIFLIVGLPLLLAPVLYFTPAFASLNLTDYLLPDKLLYHAGAFIAAIGLLSLVLPRHRAALSREGKAV